MAWNQGGGGGGGGYDNYGGGGGGGGGMTSMSDVQGLKSQVQSLASQGNYLRALQTAVGNPPNTKDEAVKQVAAEAANAAFSAIPDGKIGAIMNDLNPDEQANTMKYVYKCMALGGQNCGSLLKWHEALVKECGIGIIMRALVDRKI